MLLFDFSEPGAVRQPHKTVDPFLCKYVFGGRPFFQEGPSPEPPSPRTSSTCQLPLVAGQGAIFIVRCDPLGHGSCWKNGHIAAYAEMCEQARSDAYDLPIEHAMQLGANAVVGLRYDASEVVSQGSAAEVLCYGTAVGIEPIR
jgi:hypothetical protein